MTFSKYFFTSFFTLSIASHSYGAAAAPDMNGGLSEEEALAAAIAESEKYTPKPKTLSKFKVDFGGREIILEEVPVPEDGDCAYHAMHMERKVVVDQLREASDDGVIRSLAAPEIKAAFMRGDLPEAMKADAGYEALSTEYYHVSGELDAMVRELNTKYIPAGTRRKNAEELMSYLISSRKADDARALESKLAQLADVEKRIEAYCNTKAVYLSYVANYINRGEYLAYIPESTSFLDAIARINGINVYVWQQDEHDPSNLNLAYAVNYGVGPAPSTIHMLHTGEGRNHFNRLEKVRA